MLGCVFGEDNTIVGEKKHRGVSMNHNNYQEDAEIDIVEFCKRLLVQWKAVVIVALLFGVAVMCGKYLIDLKKFKTANTTDYTYDIEAAIDNMGIEEYNAVLNAVKVQEKLDAWNDYTKHSLYLKVSPTSYEQIRLVYRIEAMDDTHALNIIEAYGESLQADEILAEIITSSGIDSEPKYLREIINIEGQKSEDTISDEDVMVVSAMVPAGIDAMGLKNAVLAAVDSSGKLVNYYGYEYRMEFVSDTVEEVSNLEMLQSQSELISQMNTLQASHKNSEISFSNNQKKLYQAMLNADSSEMNKGMEIYSEDFVSPVLSKKYFAIGLLLGMILYIGLYLMWIVFNPYAVELVVMSSTSAPVVGEIRIEDKKSGLANFFFCDSWMQKLLYKNTDGIENIIGQMQVFSGDKDVKKLQILQSLTDVEIEDSLSELKIIAQNQGVNLSIVSLDLTDLKESLSMIDTNVPSVLAVHDGKTRKKDIRKLYDILTNQNTKVVGELYIL